MSSRYTYVLRDTKHKKKIRRQMIVASSDVNEKVKPMVIHKGLIYSGVALACIAVGAAIPNIVSRI